MLWELLLAGIITSWLTMSLAYVVAVRIGNARVVDLFWGLNFMLLVLVAQHQVVSDEAHNQAFLLTWFFVLIWGARLTLNNTLRFDRSKEDWRYATLRRAWGARFNSRAYWQVFMFKGLLAIFIAMPLFTSATIVATTSWQLVLGSTLFAGGFIYETVADIQLLRFKLVPKNRQKILMSGLWQYSRHPNYFGELVLWWGIFILSISISYWWVAILSPVFITLLITRISGLKTLEPRWARSKQYKLYKKVTPALVPSFLNPKK